MKKPEPVQRKPVLMFYDMVNYINKKYNINIRDYANRKENNGKYCNGDYPITAWCKKHGYDYTALEGNLIRAEQTEENIKKLKLRYKLSKEFNTAPDRYEFERPYLSYWDFLTNNYVNPTEEYWNLKEIIENKENENWVIEITKLFYEEFKEYTDKDGGFNILIDW